MEEMNATNNFICSNCNVTFSRKNNLRRHQKKIHGNLEITGNQVCAMCNEKCRTIIELHNHIQKEHPDIKLQFLEKIFHCQSDFDQWKAEIERESVSSFVLASTKTRKNFVTKQYKCHRSGFPATKRSIERKRHLKKSGSIKTGITCPSMIKATLQPIGDAIEIIVQYQSTHLGHKCEIGKLPLQKEERSILAGMLSAGISPSVILEKIKEQYSPTRRLWHITYGDLRNICRDFNIHVQKDIEKNQVCGVCSEKCRTILELHNHIQKDHTEIKLQFQEKMFYCQSDFDVWKAEIERESVSSFTFHHMKTYEDSVIKNYKCHRKSRKRGSEKRDAEVSKPIETGITCPSMIKATKRKLGDTIEIRVEYQSTHLGHNSEVGKLPLLKEKQCDLAGILGTGIQTSTNLDKTEEQLSPTKKIGLTIKPDVHNICRDITVNDVAHKDDSMAVDILVHKMMNDGYNPVVMYDPQGLDGEYVIDVSEIEVSQNEESSLIPTQVYTKPKINLDNEKQVIKDYIQNIYSKVEAVESVEDLTYVINLLNYIQEYLDSSKTSG